MLLFSLITFSNTSFAFQNEPDAFRGIKWGTNINTMNDMRFLKTFDEDKLYSRENDKMSIRGVPFKNILYMFWKDQLSIVMGYTDGYQNFKALKNKFFEHYGDNVKKIDSNSEIEEYEWGTADSGTTSISLRYKKQNNSVKVTFFSSEMALKRISEAENRKKRERPNFHILREQSVVGTIGLDKANAGDFVYIKDKSGRIIIIGLVSNFSENALKDFKTSENTKSLVQIDGNLKISDDGTKSFVFDDNLSYKVLTNALKDKSGSFSELDQKFKEAIINAGKKHDEIPFAKCLAAKSTLIPDKVKEVTIKYGFDKWGIISEHVENDDMMKTYKNVVVSCEKEIEETKKEDDKLSKSKLDQKFKEGQPTYDSSSEETQEQSMMAMMANLSKDDRELLKNSFMGIYMTGALLAASGKMSEDQIEKDINEMLNGKTAKEIIEMGEVLKKKINE